MTEAQVRASLDAIPAHMSKDIREAAWLAVDAQARRDGSLEGRIIEAPQEGGHAAYMIVKACKTYCRVAWLDGWDGLTDPEAVRRGGHITRLRVEELLDTWDGYKRSVTI